MINSNKPSNLAIYAIVLLAVTTTTSINDDEFASRDLYVPLEQNSVDPQLLRANLDESDADYWRQNAQSYLQEVLQDPRKVMKPKRAKNIILFLGDGMSLATVAATRMYMGNENNKLSFEKFEHFGLSKTYCIDKQVADSACTSTAYLSGVKANYGTMGLSAKVALKDCDGQLDRDAWTTSIAEWAQDQCKDTGLVTTSKVTDASPGGLYAHIANRDWENDQEVRKDGCDPSKVTDIARQLVEDKVGKKFKIVLAGGREEFLDSSTFDEEKRPGKRGDNRNLIKEWTESRNKMGKAAYVHNKHGLNSLANDTEYVLGLFNDGHCPYNVEIVERNLPKPTLSEMTETAVKHLLKLNNPNGFFLFVEGARIDMAHHDNWARIALDETREFGKAIDITRNLTSEGDTLIVVTADHSHTMTYNGYQKRGSDVLGLSDDKGDDGLPYTILSYANGPGYLNTFNPDGSRADLSQQNFKDPFHRYPATIPLKSETHGGEDVGVYASGPESHLFIGNYEQSYIPMLMAHAAKIGPFADAAGKCYPSPSNVALPNIRLVLGVLAPLLLSRLITS